MIFIDYRYQQCFGSGWIWNFFLDPEPGKNKKTDLIKIIFRFNSTEKTVECSFKSDRID